MKWLYLLLALLFESMGFIALKLSQGFTRLTPVICAVVLDLICLGLFILALKKFETGFVYMIGAGAGTALIVLSNALVFRQPLNWVQLLSILLIIIGSVGLQSQGGTH
jgi:small multidrug resistance pump